jgi:AraC-type DNA-binding domain-containing proteins
MCSINLRKHLLYGGQVMIVTFAKILKRQSLFSKFLFSFIIILLIPVITNLITFFKAKSIVEHEINRANNSIMKQIQNVLDEKVLEAQSISYQLTLNSNILSSAVDDDNNILGDPYDNLKIAEQLRNLKSANSFFSDIYIYYNKSRNITSYRSKVSSELYYQTYYKNDINPYSKWLKQIESKNLSSVENTYTSEGNGTIQIVQPITFGATQSSIATIVIVIDYSSLQKLIINADYLKDSAIAIFDKNEELIISSDARYNKLDLGKYTNDGFYNETIDGKKSVVMYLEPKGSEFKYVSIVPYTVFWEKVIYFRNLNLVGGAVFLMLGILTAYLLSRKNYNPFKNVINTISEKSNIDFDKNHNNELDFIDNVFKLTMDEKESVKEKLRRGQDTLRESFLFKLLNGSILKEVSVEGAFEKHNIKLTSNDFAVILFTLEECSGNIQPWYGKEDMELVGLVIKNIVEELIGKEHQGFFTVVGKNKYACIVNLTSIKGSQVEQDLKEICSEAKHFLEDKFNIYCSVAISDEHSGLEGIHEAYEEALDTMDYRIIFGKNQITSYHSIKNRISNYNYNNKIDLKLMHYLKSSSSADYTEDIIDEIFEQNMLNEKASIEMVKCFIYDITSIITKVINEICTPSFIQENNAVNRLIACDTLLDLKKELVLVVNEIKDFVRMEKEQNLLGTSVMRFIEENYSNHEINVNMLGDHFNISPSYLSKIFKDQVGTSILDYLYKIRIQKSKELLRESDMGVMDISTKVGFLSSSIFIRTFKKYEGITPGAFREL